MQGKGLSTRRNDQLCTSDNVDFDIWSHKKRHIYFVFTQEN